MGTAHIVIGGIIDVVGHAAREHTAGAAVRGMAHAHCDIVAVGAGGIGEVQRVAIDIIARAVGGVVQGGGCEGGIGHTQGIHLGHQVQAAAGGRQALTIGDGDANHAGQPLQGGTGTATYARHTAIELVRGAGIAGSGIAGQPHADIATGQYAAAVIERMELVGDARPITGGIGLLRHELLRIETAAGGGGRRQHGIDVRHCQFIV